MDLLIDFLEKIDCISCVVMIDNFEVVYDLGTVYVVIIVRVNEILIIKLTEKKINYVISNR